MTDPGPFPGLLRLAEIDQSFFTDRSGGGCIRENRLFCPGWVADNYDRYIDPTLQHLVLVGSAVLAGFAIAFLLAILAHRHRFLQTPFLAGTGILYTIPSIPPRSRCGQPHNVPESCCACPDRVRRR